MGNCELNKEKAKVTDNNFSNDHIYREQMWIEMRNLLKSAYKTNEDFDNLRSNYNSMQAYLTVMYSKKARLKMPVDDLLKLVAMALCPTCFEFRKANNGRN